LWLLACLCTFACTGNPIGEFRSYSAAAARSSHSRPEVPFVQSRSIRRTGVVLAVTVAGLALPAAAHAASTGTALTGAGAPGAAADAAAGSGATAQTALAGDAAGGNSDRVVVHLSVTTTAGTTPGVTNYRITRSVGVLKPGAQPPPIRPDNSISGCNQDGSYSVEVCGTVNYSAYKGGDGFRYASMSTVVNQAIREDGQARLTHLAYDIGATGRCGSGCSGTPQHHFSGGYDYPGNGQSYTQPVPWSGQYQRVSPSPVDLMGLRQDLQWARGSRLNDLYNDIDVPTS
jgi:hypothetical protein